MFSIKQTVYMFNVLQNTGMFNCIFSLENLEVSCILLERGNLIKNSLILAEQVLKVSICSGFLYVKESLTLFQKVKNLLE